MQAHVRSLRPARQQLWAALQPLLQQADAAPLPTAPPTPTPTPPMQTTTTAAATTVAAAASTTLDDAAPSPPRGAFYYLLPLPAGLSEDEALRLLAAGK